MSSVDFATPSSNQAALAAKPFGVVHACLRAAVFALRWKALTLWLIVLALPTLLAVIPVWRLIARHVDHSIYSAGWARSLDLLMLADLGEKVRQAGPVLPASVLGCGVVVLLLQPLLNAIFVASARSATALSFGALLHAGLAGYGRMLRLFIWSLPVLGVAGAGGAGFLHMARKVSESAILKSDADHARWAALALAGLLLVLARATLDAAQAGFAFDESRRSAFLAWWRGVKLICRHPIRTLWSNLLLTGFGAALLGALGLARVELHTFSGGGFLAGILLAQGLALVPGWTHAARLHAMLAVLRSSAGARSGTPRSKAGALSMANYS